MKLSFSVKGWEDISWQELEAYAVENDYSGIDLKPDDNEVYMSKSNSFDKYNSGATLRAMKDKGLIVPLRPEENFRARRPTSGRKVTKP